MKKGILLPVIALVLAALVLLGTSYALQGVAAEKANAEHLRLMRTVLPGSENFTLEPYAGEDANIVSVHKGENGFVVETRTYGYAGDITMYVGVSNDGKVTGLVVNDMQETYGLGAEALTDHVFLAQFLNKGGNFTVATHGADASSGATGDAAATAGEDIEVDAITGATVTSKAIARSVSSAVAYVTGAEVTSSATTWGG